MHRIDRRRFVAAALTAAVLPIAPMAPMAWASSKYGIEGRQAPTLALEHWIDGSGQPMSFDPSTLDARWVVLKFFQSWCPGCHRHGFPSVKRIHGAFADEPRLRMLAVQTVFEGFSTNTADRLREMQDRYDLRIPFGHDAGDPDGDRLPRTMREYRTGGTPWIVIVDPTGRVLFNDYHLVPLHRSFGRFRAHTGGQCKAPSRSHSRAMASGGNAAMPAGVGSLRARRDAPMGGVALARIGAASPSLARLAPDRVSTR